MNNSEQENPSGLPGWIRTGDTAAEIVVWLILIGGFFSLGYVVNPLLRGWAWLACGLLGAWSAIGLGAGRWGGSGLRTARCGMAVLAIPILWCGFQLIPLSSDFVLRISPVQREIQTSFREAGLSLQGKISLAHSPAKGLRSWNQLVASGLFFAGVCLLTARRSCSLRLCALVALVSLAEGWIGAIRYAKGVPRASGAIFNSNHHAALVVMGLPLYFARLVQWKRYSPRLRYGSIMSGSNPLLLFYGLGLVAIIGWLAAISRGSLILSGGVLVVWIVIEFWGALRELREGEKIPVSALLIGLLAGVVFSLSLAALVTSSSIYQGFATRGWKDELSGAGRMELWRATAEALMQTPWLGLGLFGTENALNQYGAMPMTLIPIRSHNDYVQIIAEMGVPASAVALMFLGRMLVSMIRDWSGRIRRSDWSRGLMQRAALAGVLAALAHAAVDFHLRIPEIGFVFLILLALAVNEGTLLISSGRLARLWSFKGKKRRVEREDR